MITWGVGINRKGISKDREAGHPGMVEENQEKALSWEQGRKYIKKEGEILSSTAERSGEMRTLNWLLDSAMWRLSVHWGRAILMESLGKSLSVIEKNKAKQEDRDCSR